LQKDEDGQINYVVTKQPPKNQNSEVSNKSSSDQKSFVNTPSATKSVIIAPVTSLGP
jgi:hypothetical protein